MPRVRLPIATDRLLLLRGLRPGDEVDGFAYRSVPVGMRRVAVSEKAPWFTGQWADLAVHGLRPDEWAASRTETAGFER